MIHDKIDITLFAFFPITTSFANRVNNVGDSVLEIFFVMYFLGLLYGIEWLVSPGLFHVQGEFWTNWDVGGGLWRCEGCCAVRVARG